MIKVKIKIKCLCCDTEFFVSQLQCTCPKCKHIHDNYTKIKLVYNPNCFCK